MPRLYHKKSRTGCARCRARRVKCDESKPVCNNCNRHSVACVYENAPEISSNSNTPSQETTPNGAQPCQDFDLLGDYRVKGSIVALLDLEDEFAQEMTYPSEFEDSNDFDIPESRSRRLLEHCLLQNYIDQTTKTFGACHHDDVRNAWSSKVSKLALQHDNLLYEILSMSALHLLKSKPDDAELIVARQTYHALALQEHRRAVARLNTRNADAVCCASSLMFMDAFASLQARPIEPYLPPMEWLQLARGAGSVFAVGIAALEEANEFGSTAINAIAASHHQYFNNEISLFEEINRKDLLGLLSQDILGESWDQETQQAYEKTLSYIGWVQIAINKAEHPLGICRRMMAFPVIAPKRFVGFVEEMRPRALVILAYYFALGAQMRDIWWIGETPLREIQAIQRVVSPEWQPLMREPLLRIGLVSV